MPTRPSRRSLKERVPRGVWHPPRTRRRVRAAASDTPLTVRRARDFVAAWRDEYVRLAGAAVDSMCPDPSEVVEVGGDAGAFTLPLALLLPAARIVVIDRYRPPYASSRREISRTLRRHGLLKRVRVVNADATRDLPRLVHGRAPRAVVSCEFLSELASAELAGFSEGCARVLAEGGVTVHCSLAPTARNRRQRLVIEADADPRWTRHPPSAWFSPTSKRVAAELTRAGFTGVRVRRIPSRVRMVGSAARAQLRKWGVREAFFREYRQQLDGVGLELPDWMLLSATWARQSVVSVPPVSPVRRGRARGSSRTPPAVGPSDSIAPSGFEPLSPAPKASMLGHYTTGLPVLDPGRLQKRGAGCLRGSSDGRAALRHPVWVGPRRGVGTWRRLRRPRRSRPPSTPTRPRRVRRRWRGRCRRRSERS